MLKPQWFWVWIIFTRQRSNSKMFFKQNHHYWLWKAVNPMWHHVRTPQFHQNEPLWYLGPTCSRPGSLVTPEAKSLSPRMLLHSSASRAHLCTTASLYGVNSHNNNHKKQKDGHTVSDERCPEMVSGKYQGKSAKIKLYVLLYCPHVLYYPAISCLQTYWAKGGIFLLDDPYCTELFSS